MRKSCNGKGKGNQVSKEILQIASRNSEAVVIELYGQSTGNQFTLTRKKSCEPAVVTEKKKLSPKENWEVGGGVATIMSFDGLELQKAKMNDVADKNNYQLFSDRVNLIHSR